MSWSYASALRGKHGGDSLGDDACQMKQDGDVLILVVADGAGSADLGGVGARITCEAFVANAALLLAAPRTAVLVGADSEPELDPAALLLAAIRGRVFAEADARQVEPMSLAATLVGAVITPNETTFVQVGDGAAVFRTGDDYEIALVPEETEFVNTTFFVTTPDAERHLQVRRVTEPIQEIALFSDGIQPLVLHPTDHRPHEAFFGTVFRTLREPGEDPAATDWLAKMLSSEMVTSRTDDDTSIVIARKVE